MSQPAGNHSFLSYSGIQTLCLTLQNSIEQLLILAVVMVLNTGIEAHRATFTPMEMNLQTYPYIGASPQMDSDPSGGLNMLVFNKVCSCALPLDFLSMVQ
jgi:hypothetical protein